MKSVLIVGAYGFLGSHITLKSLDHNYEIILLIKSSSDSYRISNNLLEKATIYYIDKVKIEDLYKENDIFLTVISAVSYESERSFEVYKTNFLMPLELIENGALNGCLNYIVFGSFFQKFQEYPIKKDYSLSKSYLNEVIEQKKELRIFNLQLEHMFGPNDNQNKFIPWVLGQMRNGAEQIKLTSCIQKRDFVFVDDVVSLVIRIMDKCDEFEFGYYTFEVGNGVSIELRSFLELLKKHAKSSTVLNYGSLPMPPYEIRDSSADMQSIPKELQWQPIHSLESGIRQLLI